MKRIAVVLSGCGHLDGSEIHEAVLTLLHISKNQAEYFCFAPHKRQAMVKNHTTRAPAHEMRNMLIEAARIARGAIKNISELKASDYDAVIFPGGLGAALNLCTFAQLGAQCHADPDVSRVIKEFYDTKKPIGAICIAPALIARVLGKQGIEVTIGTDQTTADSIQKMGAKHTEKKVDEICVDHKHRIVTTPAYMLGKNIAEIDAGISKLILAVLEMA